MPNGCKQPDHCISISTGSDGELCPGYCPIECSLGEIKCPTPNDPITNCPVAPSCVPVQKGYTGEECALQKCPTFCLETEYRCNGKTNEFGCKEGDTCVSKISSSSGEICPSTCPVECDAEDEVLCHGSLDPDTGCMTPDQCTIKAVDINDHSCPPSSASHGCPIKCPNDTILCPSGGDGLGCENPLQCVSKSYDNKGIACPDSSICPTLCEHTEISCPSFEEDENGCKLPDTCVTQQRDINGELCPVHCPFNCGWGEMLWYGPLDPMGCPPDFLCIDIPYKVWGDARYVGTECPNFYPKTCRFGEIKCPVQIDPCDGCPTEEVCRPKQKDNNGQFCPDDSASHDCPTLCFDGFVHGRPANNQISCPEKEEQNGCKPPEKCFERILDYFGNSCPDASVCPVYCLDEEEIQCKHGSDMNGCPLADMCLSRGRDYDGNLCNVHCPLVCRYDEELCKGQIGPNGCPGRDRCVKHGLSCEISDSDLSGLLEPKEVSTTVGSETEDEYLQDDSGYEYEYPDKSSSFIR